jgi:hypothetical protein
VKPPKASNQNNDADAKDLSATGIVKLVEEAQIKLFHSPLREPFARWWVKNHWETWRIKSSAFEDWVSAMCYHTCGRVPTRNAVAEARNALAGHALFGRPEEPVYVRLAGHDGAVYVDLCNDSWEAVRITAEGWEVVSYVPVKFIRTPGMRPLPRPIDGGTVDDLRPFLNVGEEGQWRLSLSWIIGALHPSSQFPLLVLEGTHGSAKSTFAALLRALVDPNVVPLRAAPSTERDLAISAENCWCLGIDNLSSMPHWLSDALCRLSTGGGFSTRALYKDSDEKIFEGRRPVIMNGIDIGIVRGDLLDRAITLSLPPISDEDRETEAQFWGRFEAIRPAILGSLYDAVACALRRLPQIKLSKLPRMADFATWVCAAEPALGWPAGGFLDAYERNRKRSNALALEASSLTDPIMRIAEQDMWR